MSKSPSKKATAGGAPAMPVGHRLILDAPSFGTLSAENAGLLDQYWNRARDVTDKENAVVIEKFSLCKILLPDFERIIVELRDAIEVVVEEALSDLRTLGLNWSQWGAKYSRGFVLKILPLLNDKSTVADALHRFETVKNEAESIRTWAEIADRTVFTSTRILWPAAEHGRAALIARIAGVEVAPIYPAIERGAKVVPPTPSNPMDLHFRPVRKARL